MHLTLKAISKNFGTVRAVDAVSLEVADGELFFLVGPSGCGKTTLLRMIAGFCQPDSGAVLFDGIQVNQQPAHLRNTGMVFQNYALWPHLTVADNVAFGLAVPGRRLPEKDRRARVQRMLQAVHMEEFAERKPNQLSGGQQQRVALARALVVEPACLLLDEPLSNLDAKLRLEMRIEIRRLVKQIGITTIYVTHDQAEALSMADRCLILKNGRVAQIGTPRDIYQRPANRFVADFIGGWAGSANSGEHLFWEMASQRGWQYLSSRAKSAPVCAPRSHRAAGAARSKNKCFSRKPHRSIIFWRS